MIPKGTQVSEAVEQPGTASHLKALGDANVAPRGLSVGSGDHGTPVGRFDAHYATYRTKAADVDLIVPHTLGRVPQTVWLISQEATAQATANSHLRVALTSRNLWTATTFRARITGNDGGVGDMILTFMVG